MTLSYKLRYNRDAGEYLNEVHFKELLQWITTETMLAVRRISEPLIPRTTLTRPI